MTVGVLLAGLPTPCGAQASDARIAAWERYSQASEALAECRERGMHGRLSPSLCLRETAAAEAAEARYRAEIGATQATKQP
jgi:hypothetical protein